VGDDSRGDGEPERLRLSVELAEQDAGLGPGRARLRINADAPHLPEIDHYAAVADAEARVAVAAASKRYRSLRLTREAHSRDHIGDAGTPRDERGRAVDRPVPDPAVIVVRRVSRSDDWSPKGAFELAERGFIEVDFGRDALTVTQRAQAGNRCLAWKRRKPRDTAW
jgi:hypothetical protein